MKVTNKTANRLIDIFVEYLYDTDGSSTWLDTIDTPEDLHYDPELKQFFKIFDKLKIPNKIIYVKIQKELDDDLI